MTAWLSVRVAVVLMYAGVLPSLGIIYLLYDDRHKPGVVWFLALMATGGLWAFLYASFTLVQSVPVTLALANFFWAAIPAAAIFMFLLAYEYVFKSPVSPRLVLVLFLPVLVLFGLSWTNPQHLVFTPAYGVGPDGILQIPPVGGPVKLLVTKVYGYLLTSFAAGIFLGEILRTDGLRRRQTIYLFLILVALAASTLIKIFGLVPEYFDPTSAAYSVSGLLFAYSIQKHGLLRFISVGRDQAFEEIKDIVLIVDADGIIVEVNQSAEGFFGGEVVGATLDSYLPQVSTADGAEDLPTVELAGPAGQRHFACQTSTVRYGRTLEGKIVVLNDITSLQQRQDELYLLKEILTRIFRHNMSNALTVIHGNASYIRAETGAFADQTSAIIDRVEELQTQAEKAQAFEKIFEHHEPVTRSLREEIDAAVSHYAGQPDVSIRTAVDDVHVAVHPDFNIALRELIENAITHDDTAGETEVTLSTGLTDTHVHLRISDSGPGIPANETTILQPGGETTLQHSTGIGLWLVNQLLTQMDCSLEIETDATGTRIHIELPRSDPSE